MTEAREWRPHRILPEQSAVLVEARSNVGPITFGTTSVSGTIELAREGDALDLSTPPKAHLEVRLGELVSGNSLYDAELHRRVNVRRYPLAVVELDEVRPAASGSRFEVSGPVTLHGVTRRLSGTVAVSFPEGDRVVVAGEHVVDMRDFDVSAPGMLMLKIYPDVRVVLHLEGRRER